MKSKDEQRTYDEITNLSQLKRVIENYLNEYNRQATSKTSLDIVIFALVIEHVSRIVRIIKQPNGHAMLIGIGGTGRTCVTKMATFMADMQLFQIEITKKYKLPEWRQDLKNVLRKCGEQGSPVVFYLSDYQIKDEGFLSDLNILLNTGYLPNLFENEEVREIILNVRIFSQFPIFWLATSFSSRLFKINTKYAPTNEGEASKPTGASIQQFYTSSQQFYFYSKFIERIRLNLHIVLAFSPFGELFRKRIRSYQSLVNCSTIDFFKVSSLDLSLVFSLSLNRPSRFGLKMRSSSWQTNFSMMSRFPTQSESKPSTCATTSISMLSICPKSNDFFR